MNKKLQILVQFLCISLATVNAFWWGSTKDLEEEEPIKRIPVHLIRTLTYHPILIPNPPMPPVQPFQYARGFLSSFPSSVPSSIGSHFPSHLQTPNFNPYSSNNYNPYTNYQTNPPASLPTTTQKLTHPPPTTTTTLSSSTTTEATTTQQDQFPTLSVKYSSSGKSPVISDRFSQQSLDFTGSQPIHNNPPSNMQGNLGSLGSYSQFTKGQDPYNLQYVTNIAPMNVQFVPCMCPVEVRISPSDAQHISENSKEETLLETNINELDETVE